MTACMSIVPRTATASLPPGMSTRAASRAVRVGSPIMRGQDRVDRTELWCVLRMRIGKRFGLEDIALAHAAVEQGTGDGNVIVDVRE
jgi:hypothetical protein